MGEWLYIMTIKRNGTLYIGVTNDLVSRVWEHGEGTGSSFIRRYGLTKLVYFEHHDDTHGGNPVAIQPEALASRVAGSAAGGSESGVEHLCPSLLG